MIGRSLNILIDSDTTYVIDTNFTLKARVCVYPGSRLIGSWQYVLEGRSVKQVTDLLLAQGLFHQGLLVAKGPYIAILPLQKGRGSMFWKGAACSRSQTSSWLKACSINRQNRMVLPSSRKLWNSSVLASGYCTMSLSCAW